MTQAVADELDHDDGQVADVDAEEDVDLTADDTTTDAAADEPEEVAISIGEESPTSDEEEDKPEDSTAIRALRQANREHKERIRELERERKQQTAATPDQAIVVGPKPTLASSDYDEDKFERDLEAWHTRKRASEDKQRADQAKQEKANEAWAQQVAKHDRLRKELKVKDADETEQIARDGLSQIQQNLIVDALDNSAMTMYALGKNPKKLKELASIESPVKFVAAVAKLETQLKVTPRKTAPIPDSIVRGNARPVLSDATLTRLEAEADRTGDRSKVVKYKRDLKLKATKT